jgi:predicted flap endonuclease-1-like 5' DNA nuclease
MTHIALIIMNNLPIYLLQEDQPGGGISGWVWVIIILFIVLLVAWRLISNRGREDFPLSEHGEPSEHRIEAQPLIQEQPLDTASERIDEERAMDMEASRGPVSIQTETPATPDQTPDNLVVIEGIGPKIASILAANAITTYAQLAATPANLIKQILDREGLHMAEPTTWPEQARLAAAGDWDGLNALQDRLKAGRQE